MALPGSGVLSFSAIAGELGIGLSNVSLRSMSSTAGKSTPDSVSEFYGYSNFTYTYYASYYAIDPCYYLLYDIYTGSDGKYYATDNGGVTYTLVYSIGDGNEFWYEYLYYEPYLDGNVYREWLINSASTVFTNNGNVFSLC